MVGATVALFSLKSRTFSTNSTNSVVSDGVPWSGQDRYCIYNRIKYDNNVVADIDNDILTCVTSLSVPVSTSTKVKSL